MDKETKATNNYEKLKELCPEAMAEFLVLIELSAYRELGVEFSEDEIEMMYDVMLEMLLRTYPPYLGVVG